MSFLSRAEMPANCVGDCGHGESWLYARDGWIEVGEIETKLSVVEESECL